MKHPLYLIAIFLLLFITACKDDDTIRDTDTEDEVVEISDEVKLRNLWVKNLMQEVYLWEDLIPTNLTPFTEPSTFDFFDKIIYDIEDKWSFISDDYYETQDMFDGISTTSGMEFYLTYMSDNYSVMGVVEYVLPNTPASEAGIKRGDVFTKINNMKMDEFSYYGLVTLGGTYSLTIDSFISMDTTKEMRTVEITEIENYQENPVYIDSIYYIDGKRIGYLMYNSFIADFDSTDIKRTFQAFKAADITDLVMDLRYNLGGDGTAMQNLANLIAPTSALGEIFMKEIWNKNYKSYWSDNLIEYQNDNINLTGKLVGLTTSSSASASEGLLNGLDPLLDFTQIGTATHGKYTGMVVLGDNDKNPQWAVVPIVMKTTNKDERSVRGGMFPDINLKDNPFDGYQLGDIRETYLAKAIETITGQTTTKSAKAEVNTAIIGRFKGSREMVPYPIIVDTKELKAY